MGPSDRRYNGEDSGRNSVGSTALGHSNVTCSKGQSWVL